MCVDAGFYQRLERETDTHDQNWPHWTAGDEEEEEKEEEKEDKEEEDEEKWKRRRRLA